jgi:hypothetical protein
MSIRYCPHAGCHQPYRLGQTCHGYPHSMGLLAPPTISNTILRAEIAEEMREERFEREVAADVFVAEAVEEVVEDIFFGGDDW